MFIAPAAQHRLMRPLRDRAAFKRSVNRQVIIGLVPLSLAITLATFFVISNVVSNLAAGIVAGIAGAGHRAIVVDYSAAEPARGAI